MRKFLIGLWQDESGAAGAEYALILAIVAVGIALAAENLGGAISGAMNEACGEITNGAGGASC